jgi:hypothetical protein
MASGTSAVSTTNDFKQAFENLDPNGRNWVIFRKRFTIAVKAKRVWDHFDGSSIEPQPVDPNAPTSNEAQAQKEWWEREDFAMYLITQKIEDSTLRKHASHDTVAKLWAAIVAEFTQKSQMAQAHLRSELMAMRAKGGTSLHTEFDRLCSAHDDCLAAGVTISEDEYRSIIINFCPPSLGSFISQVSANAKINSILMKVITSTSTSTLAPIPITSTSTLAPISLDLELMISIILEEYDRRGKFIRKDAKEPKDSSPGVAATTHASEKPGSTSGGGKNKRGPRKPVGVCWTCGDPNHKKDQCPQKDNSNGKDDKGKGKPSKSPNNSNQGASGSKTTNSANVALLDENVGTWTAIVTTEFGPHKCACNHHPYSICRRPETPSVDVKNLDEYLEDEQQDLDEDARTHSSMPSLVPTSVSNPASESKSSVDSFATGCRENAKSRCDDKDGNDPDAAFPVSGGSPTESSNERVAQWVSNVQSNVDSCWIS